MHGQCTASIATLYKFRSEWGLRLIRATRRHAYCVGYSIIVVEIVEILILVVRLVVVVVVVLVVVVVVVVEEVAMKWKYEL